MSGTVLSSLKTLVQGELVSFRRLLLKCCTLQRVGNNQAESACICVSRAERDEHYLSGKVRIQNKKAGRGEARKFRRLFVKTLSLLTSPPDRTADLPVNRPCSFLYLFLICCEAC